MQPNRLGKGGRIDRTRALRFFFNGVGYSGFEGDTLASALIANGVRLTARSFKYHRPRGIVGAGVEEPATLVELVGEDASGNRPATTVRLRDGEVAGWGECVPYARYGETLESVTADIEGLPEDITRAKLDEFLPALALSPMTVT